MYKPIIYTLLSNKKMSTFAHVKTKKPHNSLNQHYAECICRYIGISFDEEFIALDFISFKESLQERIKRLAHPDRLLTYIVHCSDFRTLHESVMYVWKTT